MAGSTSNMPIELVVQSSGTSTSPDLQTNQCTSILSNLNTSQGELIDGEKNHIESALSNEFRLAFQDRRRVRGLIAKAENHPTEAWCKALLWAAAFGHVEFITEFIDRRPPGLRNLLQDAEDNDGFTALHRAVVMGQKDVVKVLTRSHDHNNARSMELFEILHARTPEGWTSLHLAVVTGDVDMVQILIDSYHGLTATLPPIYEWDFSDNFWMTPLHYAVLGNWQAVMRQLLDWPLYDQHVNAHDYYMRTAAHLASSNSAGEASMEILVSYPKVDINAVDCCLYTPLHWAVHVEATETVRCLVSRAGERTIRTTEEDIEGRPVFQTAIEKKSLDRRNKDIGKLLLTCTELKDEVQRLYRDRQVYVDASNAILVGAALIASVTFGGWLQPPGGTLGGNGGQADTALQVFWTFNSLSFFFSIATVMAGAGAVLPMEHVYIGRAVNNIRRALELSSSLLIISVVLVLGAFGASGFASQSSTQNLVHNMMVSTCVGSAICAIVLLWFLQRLYKIRDNWTPLVFPAIRKCYQHMTRRRRRLDLADIQRVLEAAEVRAREALHKKYGKSALERFHHSDLTALLFALGKASNRAFQLRRVAHDAGLLMGIMDGKGGSLSVGHVKERVLEERILAFEEAYEKARMIRTGSGRVQDPNWNMLTLSHIGSRGLHHWIDEFPAYYCRRHSLEKDATVWARIHHRLVRVKKPQLEEENTKFEYGLEYGMLDFESSHV